MYIYIYIYIPAGTFATKHFTTKANFLEVPAGYLVIVGGLSTVLYITWTLMEAQISKLCSINHLLTNY